jgi:hypothetical protein
VYGEPHGRQDSSLALRSQAHGVKNQVGFRALRQGGTSGLTSAADARGRFRSSRKERRAHDQVQIQGEAEAVEAWAQVRGGGWDADFYCRVVFGCHWALFAASPQIFQDRLLGGRYADWNISERCGDWLFLAAGGLDA